MSTIQKYPGHLALLFINIFFGLNMVISKDLLDGFITPAGLNTLRFLAGAVFFWMLGLFRSERVESKDLLYLLGGSVFGLVLNLVFFINGLAHTSSLNAAIISTTVPMLTMLFAALILKEPISFLKVLGVLVGAAGALILVLSSGGTEDRQSSLYGDLLCLGSSISYALFLVITKPVAQKYSATTSMKWMFLFAVLLTLPFGIDKVLAVDFQKFGLNENVSLGFVLVFATIVPYLLLPVAQKRLRPTTQSMYNYVLPVVAFSLAVFAGTSAITLNKVLATLLVFIGVYIVTRSKSRADMNNQIKSSDKSLGKSGDLFLVHKG